MISYKIGLLPVIPFSLVGIPSILKMLEIGFFVLIFMIGCITLNNYFFEPLVTKINKWISK